MLRDVNGRDVPISVDIVNATKELVAGETLPPGEIKPHMVLTPGRTSGHPWNDAHRMEGRI
jgi:hypothetical protein